MTDIKKGDRFEDEHHNRIEVLSVDDNIVRAEYTLPLSMFLEKYGSNRTHKAQRDEGLLIERLKNLDVDFSELDERTGYKSPLPDSDVERFDKVEPFNIEGPLNLSVVTIAFSPNSRYGPEQFPGAILENIEVEKPDGERIEWSNESEYEGEAQMLGFVVLFEDGQGVSFAGTQSKAEDQIETITRLIHELDLS